MLQQILQLLQQLVTWKNDVISNAKTTEELDALDPILRNALFRAFVSGQSKKISIQELIDEIASELALGNVPVVFKPVVIDFNSPGNTKSKIIAKLNTSANYVLKQGTLYIPYVQRIVLTNGEGINDGGANSPNYAVITEQYFLTQQIDPDDEGVASIGIDGTEILSNGIRYFNTVDDRSLEPVDFYLGDIDTDEIWDVVNLLGPGTDPVGPLSTPNGTTVLFYATQDGEDRIWLYRGQQEQVGVGEPETVEDDYRLFPSEDGTDPPPIYQETKPQNSSSISGITLFLHNHEGYVAGMENAFYQAVFKTRRLKLLGYSRVLIDTTGETAYPVVENKWLVKLTGTSGTATLTIDGSDYVITYGLGLDETANAFVSANAATILSAHDLTLIYNSDGFLELDGNVSLTISIANTTGTLNGSVKAIPSVLIDSPDFEADLIFDMFTEYDGYQLNTFFRKR